MKHRIRDVLIVSSLYDFYIFEEDGRLYELLRSEYQGLNLSHTPELTRVSSGREAIALLTGDNRFDLVITTLHIEDMGPAAFAKTVRDAHVDIPIAMLAFDNRELADMLARKENILFDETFVWQGDYRLLLAIIKHLEDRLNVEHDTHVMGVQSIILVEDTIKYYSSMLPLIYLELIHQSGRFIQEGVNLSHKNLRQRARPKILLAKNYEAAIDLFEKHHSTVMGIISDVEFPRNGKLDSNAGFRLAKVIRRKHDDIPILIHSTDMKNRDLAEEIGCLFVHKESTYIRKKIRQFMTDNLSFGDFLFRLPDGSEVERASDLISLERCLEHIPEASLIFHAARNHFSHWLKARTEFWLAHSLRPRKVSDFDSPEGLRRHLISKLREYRQIRQRGMITEFDAEIYDQDNAIAKIGTGSLGGKARGLAFFNMLINNYGIQDQFKGIHILIPAAVIVATDVFDQFLDMNELREFALNTDDDRLLIDTFRNAKHFPEPALSALQEFLEIVKAPLAIRSSGLLEDSHVHPFAGVYETVMEANCATRPDQRLKQLIDAIKTVYASTFFKSAKDYLKATDFQADDEKMAVIIQKVAGSARGTRFYPLLSGTAQSFNFYPTPPQTSEDGIASIALGLGRTVVEGGSTLRFSPEYPNHILQLSSPKLALNSNQHTFYALDLCNHINKESLPLGDQISSYPLDDAEKDGTLFGAGSTFSPENDTIYDGLSRPGIRLVTFAPVLKFKTFPLADILKRLLDLGSWGMGTPVDIEFAADWDPGTSGRKTLNVLQIRPMVLTREVEGMEIDDVIPDTLICQSRRVMGNGVIDGIHDIIMVDRSTYERSKSNDVADEISKLNAKLVHQHRPYLLIGVGRWGSMDNWLGIPVRWDQISGARVIIEGGFRDFDVEPSQGSHFMENLNSFSVGYFTVMKNTKDAFVDWEWLRSQKDVEKLKYTRHMQFDRPITIKMNGRHNKGIIIKPGEDNLKEME
ncbi:histidine kinase [bacterium]|nr:histidine kinase [bacterium]